MQTHHTPGPWHLAGDAEGTMITASKGAQVAMWPPQGGTVEQCANARLIAAAPDLLAALQEARSMVYHMTGDSATCAPWNALLPRLDAAIARATGQ